MKTIGITGIEGFLGWHLRCFFHHDDACKVIGAGRDTFANAGKLDDFIAQCDCIIHLAGMIRGEESRILRTNLSLTEQIINACIRRNYRKQIIFISSIHCNGDSAYGTAKRKSSALLRSWARRHGGQCCNLIFSHLFGEKARHHYNSVVATFCFQLANGQSPTVIDDHEIRLLHAQEACTRIAACIGREETWHEETILGEAILVSDLLQKLKSFDACYRNQVIPDLRARFDLMLFNAYRWHWFPGAYPVDIPVKRDERGHLFEFEKSLHGGQTFFSTTKPSVTRGNHYHRYKIERFCVIHGEGAVRIRRLFDDKVHEFPVSGDKPQYIDIPTFHTHSITNTGSGEMATLFWSHELFHPAKPDTFHETV